MCSMPRYAGLGNVFRRTVVNASGRMHATVEKMRTSLLRSTARRSNIFHRILAKLEALGWNDELSKGHTMSIFVGLPAVKQNKELTERSA